MAKNTYQKSKKVSLDEPKQGAVRSFLDNLGQFFSVENRIESLPSHYLYYALWVLGLVFMYIYAQHANEAYIRQVDQMKDSIEVLRLEYVSKKASYMHETKKSIIQQKVQSRGLEENLVRPQKIVLDD